MPQIPLPTGDRGQFNQRAMSIPELTVRATPDAFGANIAEANYRGNMQLAQNYEALGRSESQLAATIGGAVNNVVKIAGEVWQRDQKLEAERKMNDLSMGIDREMESTEATGDGSSRTRMLTSFDERANRLVDEAQSPFQAAIYREGIQRLRFQQERKAVAAEVAAMKQARIDNITSIVEGGEVAIFRDPAALAATRDRTLATIAESNLTPSQRAKLTQEAERRFTRIAIERMLIDNNITGARSLMAEDRTITALGGLDSVRITSQITRAAEQLAEREAHRKFTEDLLAGRRLADPLSTEDRRVISEAFTTSGGPQQIAAGNPDVVPVLVGMASRTGIIPSSALTILNSMALNGEGPQRVYALQTIAAIEHASPGIMETSGAHKQLRERAEYFSFLTSGTRGLGLDTATAMERVTARMSPDFIARMTARKTQTDLEVKNRTETELAAAFGAGFWSSLSVGNPRDRASIVHNYQEAYRYHVTQTDNEQEATAAALRDMQRMYGVTRLSGGDAGRIVRQPVELRLPAIGEAPMLPTSRDTRWDWVRSQAADEIKAATGRVIAPENIYFEATPATDAAIARGGWQAGHTPPYSVYWREPVAGRPGELGPPQTIPGRLFQPDVTAARRRALEAAEAERARAVESDRRSPHMLLREGLRAIGVPGLPPKAGERSTPAPDAPAPRTVPTLGGERRRRTSALDEDARQNIADLFGFGARVAATGAA